MWHSVEAKSDFHIFGSNLFHIYEKLTTYPMKTPCRTAVLVLACTLCPMADLPAKIIPKEVPIKNWLKENRLLVGAQMRCLDLPVEVGYRSEVADFIERYLRPGRRETERMLGRAAYYFPIFEQELRRHHLPEALKYLPMVESGLLPAIESPAGAVGLWQFMPATARYFGLTMNEMIDERRDPRRSSAQAAQLLRMLYDEFCDWSLTLAAYNCGPGRVKRLIRKTGSERYEAIRPYLPGQTRRYIDKYKAVAYVATYYSDFGLTARPAADLTAEVIEIRWPRPLNFRFVSAKTKLPMRSIRALNPASLQEIAPVTGTHCSIVLPLFAAEQLMAVLQPREQAAIADAAASPESPSESMQAGLAFIARPLGFSLDRLKYKFENVHGVRQFAPAVATLPQSKDPGHEDNGSNGPLEALRKRAGLRLYETAH